MVDLPADSDIVKLVRAGDGKMLVVASTGHGLVVDMQGALAQTRNGKQVLNLSGSARAVACAIVAGDTVASVGVNRKLIVFDLEEVRKWAVAKALFCSGSKMAVLPMLRCLKKPKALAGRLVVGVFAPNLICQHGWHGVAVRANCRQTAFRAQLSLPKTKFN